MIGQKKLLSTINNLIENNLFPRSVLVEGEYGCGKHLLCEEISKKLLIDLFDLTEHINLEMLENIQLSPIPRIYVIDCDKITVKEQNMILKFIEEPLKNSYVILLTTSKNNLLQTIQNRCQNYRFDPYSKNELEFFVETNNFKYLADFCTTPGWIKKLSECNLEEIIDLCKKILVRIKDASCSNILTIPGKISFKNEEDTKIDFDIFSYVLLNISKSLYLSNVVEYSIYCLTNEFYNNTKIQNINKKQVLENYLISLKLHFESGVTK